MIALNMNAKLECKKPKKTSSVNNCLRADVLVLLTVAKPRKHILKICFWFQDNSLPAELSNPKQ